MNSGLVQVCGHSPRLLLLRIFSYFRLISTEVTGVALAISRVSAVYDFIEKYTENGGARMSNSLPFPKEGWSFVK